MNVPPDTTLEPTRLAITGSCLSLRVHLATVPACTAVAGFLRWRLMRPIFFAIIATLLVGCASSQTRTHQAASPFRYDDDIQSSIRKSWEGLSHGKNRAGEIVLEFHLTSDGRITDIKVIKDSVGNGQAQICEKAVFASVPYPPWPADMVRMVGKSFRVCTFTFNY